MQNPVYIKDKFRVLNVDKDNVKMSDFIKNTLGVNFENGGAFYEFTQVDEDLLSYKEVVRMHTVSTAVAISIVIIISLKT